MRRPAVGLAILVLAALAWLAPAGAAFYYRHQAYEWHAEAMKPIERADDVHAMYADQIEVLQYRNRTLLLENARLKSQAAAYKRLAEEEME